MNKSYKILATVTVSTFLLSFALMADAASDPKKLWPLLQCGYSTGGITYPPCDFKEASILVSRLLNWFISMAGVVATITFSIAGFKILTNPGNPTEIQAGKDMFYKTVWGMLIVLGAWLLVNTIVSALVKSNSALFFLRN